MTHPSWTSVTTACKSLSLEGKITFPEVLRRLQEVGIERYHVDLTRDETTYYHTNGESQVVATPPCPTSIAGPFSADEIQAAVQASQRGDILYPEFVQRIRAAGCVAYFTQITGQRVQYMGRSGDMHVEYVPGARK